MHKILINILIIMSLNTDSVTEGTSKQMKKIIINDRKYKRKKLKNIIKSLFNYRGSIAINDFEILYGYVNEHGVEMVSSYSWDYDIGKIALEKYDLPIHIRPISELIYRFHYTEEEAEQRYKYEQLLHEYLNGWLTMMKRQKLKKNYVRNFAPFLVLTFLKMI